MSYAHCFTCRVKLYLNKEHNCFIRAADPSIISLDNLIIINKTYICFIWTHVFISHQAKSSIVVNNSMFIVIMQSLNVTWVVGGKYIFSLLYMTGLLHMVHCNWVVYDPIYDPI